MRRLTALSLLCALTACGGDIRQAIGLDRNAPDEFQVVTRAPLSVPPSYDLRPPRPGAPRPQEQSSQVQARSALLNASGRPLAAPAIDPAAAASPAEAFLLQQTGAVGVNPDIRAALDAENAARAQAKTQPIDALLPAKGTGADPVVDAGAEAERVRTAKKDNLPVDTSQTATINPPEDSLWQRVKDLF
ncbi:MAG: DUF3035 domain-containing protein [Alphaproteobacteria bacterium]|jgi:hypothetical protein|nr:DUF3035 domain-containing protein [Alphaproteobacteria bacterium]